MKLSILLEEYILIKNNINELNSKLKEKKTLLNNNKDIIINYMNNKKINNLTHQNNKINIKHNKTYSSISQKYLKDILTKYFDNNEDKVNHLLDYILKNRQETISSDLLLSC